jgi:hypothetical protein
MDGTRQDGLLGGIAFNGDEDVPEPLHGALLDESRISAEGG